MCIIIFLVIASIEDDPEEEELTPPAVPHINNDKFGICLPKTVPISVYMYMHGEQSSEFLTLNL